MHYNRENTMNSLLAQIAETSLRLIHGARDRFRSSTLIFGDNALDGTKATAAVHEAKSTLNATACVSAFAGVSFEEHVVREKRRR